MRAARDAVAPSVAAGCAEAAGRRVLALAELAGSPRVALYAAVGSELPTRALFEALRAAGKRCLLPGVEGPEMPLWFEIVERWEDLRPGRYGVPEPEAGGDRIALGPGDLAVVPGLAFDQEGRRLGAGAGHYDRTFPPGWPAPFLVGFAFDLQRVERVPSAPHDRAMDVVVTERGAWRAGARQG